MPKVTEITSFLNASFGSVEVLVSTDADVRAPCSLGRPNEGGVCFYNKKRWTASKLDISAVALLITTKELDDHLKEALVAECRRERTALIAMDQPRSGFMAVVKEYFSSKTAPGIHPSAIIDPSAKIDPTASIGAGTVVGPDVQIGPNTEVAELVVIGGSAKIGANCYIAPGVKIGQRGFGYERQPNGEMLHFPHLGSILIGDNVEIGANTCIDRGTIDDTVIHDGVKIDNLCHISHNVEVLHDAAVIANSMIGGSSRIGARCWIAPSVNVINGVSVGDDVTVGMASTVVKPAEPRQTLAGSPAMELSEFVFQRRVLKQMMDSFREDK